MSGKEGIAGPRDEEENIKILRVWDVVSRCLGSSNAFLGLQEGSHALMQLPKTDVGYFLLFLDAHVSLSTISLK